MIRPTTGTTVLFIPNTKSACHRLVKGPNQLWHWATGTYRIGHAFVSTGAGCRRADTSRIKENYVFKSGRKLITLSTGDKRHVNKEVEQSLRVECVNRLKWGEDSEMAVEREDCLISYAQVDLCCRLLSLSSRSAVHLSHVLRTNSCWHLFGA